MDKLTDVTVVGGGVVGCFIAYRLALEGVAVTLVEREHVGAGASGASAGNVQPGEFEPIAGAERLNPLEAESLALHRRFLPAIKAESGVDPLDHEVQYLYAALNDREVTHTQQFAATLQGVGLRAEWIDGVAARTLEPRLSPHLLGGTLHQDCMQMDAHRFVEALARAAKKRGTTLYRGEVVGLRRDGTHVTGVRLKDGSMLGCETLIVAMGAWTGPAMAQWLGISLPIEPHSLQKLHVRPAGSLPACAIRWGGANIVGRVDGLVHVGSRYEHTGFEAHPSEDGKRWLLERLQTILPGLDAAVVEARAGLAATLPGRTPMLGPVHGLEGVYLAVPSSNGFLLSAVLAQILSELLVHGKQHPFLPMILPGRVLQSAVAR
jgi:glycine oxidase